MRRDAEATGLLMGRGPEHGAWPWGSPKHHFDPWARAGRCYETGHACISIYTYIYIYIYIYTQREKGVYIFIYTSICIYFRVGYFDLFFKCLRPAASCKQLLGLPIYKNVINIDYYLIITQYW